MNTQPIEGFWCQKTGIYHYFVSGDSTCLCGSVDLKEMAGAEHRDRKPGREDCCKCTDIYREIHAQRPPAEPEPDWKVKKEEETGAYVLYYKGIEQSRSRLGSKVLEEMAVIYNRKGAVPKKSGKAKCAADAPNPEKFIAKKANHSPELPLPRAYAKQDFEELITYLESLFDSSPLGSVKKPPYFEHAAREIDVESENMVKILRWLYRLNERELAPLCGWLAWMAGEHDNEIAHPPCIDALEKQMPEELTILQLTEILKTIRFIFQLQPPTPNTAAAMPKAPANTKPSAEITTPEVETFPASDYRRYPTNRTPSPEAVKEMTASVRDLGILQPIIARLIPGEEQIEILAGETRWLGCKAIRADYPVPCFLRNVDDKEAAKIHAVENFQRKDLNPIEEGREIKNMLDCGWTIDEIMKHVGKEKDYLYKRLNLLELPEKGKQAFLDGNLSLNTVSKLLTLPEEKREAAIQSVTEPTHSDRAMPEKEALQYLQKSFVEPLEKAAAWEERRALLEKEYPGCEWLTYEHARKAGSNFEHANDNPQYGYLSDAAREEELVVPTWGELAQKHGAKKYIGMSWNGEAGIFVSADELVEAEKAAHDDKPEDCIFTHEKAVQKTRDAAEKRKIEQAAAREQLNAEKKKLVTLILTPGAINKTATLKLARKLFDEISDDFESLGDIFGIEFDPSTDDHEEHAKKIDTALTKAFKNKEMTPFEVLGRLVIANETTECSYRLNEFAVAAINAGAVKITEFPEFAKIHAAKLAREAETAKAAEEKNGFADGEPESKKEEDAA